MAIRGQFLFVVLSCVGLLASCGEDDESNSPSNETSSVCGSSFAACGGDVVGAWNFTRTCGSFTVSQPFDSDPACASSLATVTAVLSRQDLEFAADMRYSMSIDADVSTAITVTQQCNDAIFVPATLQFTCSALQSSMEQDDPSATCTVSDETCLCSSDRTQSSTETGTYSLAGSRITTTPDDPNDDPETLEYCVDGDQLQVLSEDDDGDNSIRIVYRRGT